MQSVSDWASSVICEWQMFKMFERENNWLYVLLFFFSLIWTLLCILVVLLFVWSLAVMYCSVQNSKTRADERIQFCQSHRAASSANRQSFRQLCLLSLTCAWALWRWQFLKFLLHLNDTENWTCLKGTLFFSLSELIFPSQDTPAQICSVSLLGGWHTRTFCYPNSSDANFCSAAPPYNRVLPASMDEMNACRFLLC